MRTQGFGTIAELVRDIVYQNNDYQNIESARIKRPGKTNLEIMSSSFTAEQLLFCSTG
jgi:hypothetical protein